MTLRCLACAVVIIGSLAAATVAAIAAPTEKGMPVVVAAILIGVAAIGGFAGVALLLAAFADD